MKILSILSIIIGFSQCASIKFEKNPPFEIISAVYLNWTGGQSGVKGINVKINYTADSSVEFDSIYFRNKITNLQIKKANKGQLIIGYFNTSSIKNNMVLDENPIKEINNPIPRIKKFPFELKENEAVISYKIKGKIKYYKVKSIVKEKSMKFSSAPK